jgi:hypothetical protein
MFITRPNRAAVALGAVFVLAACGGNAGAGSVPAPNAGGVNSLASRVSRDASKTLYVTSRDNKEIFGFPEGSNGNVAPTVTIGGSKTKLYEPLGFAVDSTGKIYVANDGGNRDNEVLIFPAGANGNVAPTVLGGSKVKIQRTEGVAIDASDNLYVSDWKANAIYVWKKGATGNVKPIRTISGAKTLLDVPCGMAFDSAGNLWIANDSQYFNQILEFASGANGNVAPIANIAGPKTGLDGPFSVSIDPTNRIITSNEGSTSVEVFAAGANGNAAPIQTITGSNTKLTNVTTVGIDPKGHIYATTLIFTSATDSILTFAANANGNATPIDDITGSKTGFREPLYPQIH